MELLINKKGFNKALKTLCMVMLTLTVSFSAYAQVNVTGTVKEASGMGLPGVSVVVTGTTTGVLTDFDGNFSITVPSTTSVLSFSFIGYVTQEVTVGNQRTINIVLAEDVQQLDEIVVVGYGTQAKKDITGSVTVVSAEALAESTSVTFAEALQGKSSGVYVSTSGAPGADATIRIRGVGSVNGSDPLVIIDGVSGGTVSSVPSNDIETFQVLKDASATAIYGAQAANGVIIITTKKGTKTNQPRVSYNGYVGLSTMANKGFDLLNAWEFMEFTADGMRNLHNYRGEEPQASMQFGELKGMNVGADGSWAGGTLTMPFTTVPAGRSYQQVIEMYGGTVSGNEVADMQTAIQLLKDNYMDNGTNSNALSAYYYNKLMLGMSDEDAMAGTDWYDLIVQKGLIMDHQLSVVGGNDKGQYSLSVNYTSQEGTVKSSFYDRYSIRFNTTFSPRKYLDIGASSSFAVTDREGQRSNGGAFYSVYMVKPFVAQYNVDGNYAGAWNEGGGNSNTALAAVETAKGDWTRNMSSQNSVYLEIKPVKGLSLKSQVAAVLTGAWTRTFAEKSIVWNKEGATRTSLTETGMWGLNLQWTNTATYIKKFGDHDLTVVVGSEALDQGFGRNLSATRYNYAFPENENTWVIENGGLADLTNGGGQGSHVSMFGYFGRGDYSYKGKYLATVAVRRDASSKFSDKYRWGTFPSISLGWRISDESFMSSTSGWLTDLKIRGGYGTTGNSNIGSYNWANQYATGSSYHYAVDGSNTPSTGFAVSALGDTEAKWETTRMLNIGFDASLFKDRLNVEFDYYVKRTSDMLVAANWSAIAGSASKPNINIGDMDNKGFDVSVGWNDKVGKFSYGLSANISQYKNEVVKLGSSDLFYSTRIDNITITTEGQPIGMYYGYQSLGIYTSVDDVLNHKDAKGNTILPYGITDIKDLKPEAFVGRYKFEDHDGSGTIDDGDQQIIGNPHPDFTGGLNLTAGYGNFDFSTYLYFSVGQDLYKYYEYFTLFSGLGATYATRRAEESWSPENPDGQLPMFIGTENEATESSSISTNMYIEDGSYLRMQTIQLGYTFPESITQKIDVNKLRIYGQISNLFTLTNYTGLDPEIQVGNDRSKGVDQGGYGMPRQFIFGVNLTF